MLRSADFVQKNYEAPTRLSNGQLVLADVVKLSPHVVEDNESIRCLARPLLAHTYTPNAPNTSNTHNAHTLMKLRTDLMRGWRTPTWVPKS